jgi:SAM-dependent methyltransferase
MRVDTVAALRAWRTFAGSGPARRAFIAARLVVLPLGPLDPVLRALEGRVISLGCGFGIVERYVAEINAQVRIEGIELDDARVRAAAMTAHRSPRVTVRRGDVADLDLAGRYDAAMAIDLFHHLGPREQERTAEGLARSLRPGALCLVKDIATTPRWQYLWNRAHDRIVAGREPIHCRPPTEMAALLEESGLSIREAPRLTPRGPYPHYVVIAFKPVPSGALGVRRAQQALDTG